MTSFPSDNSFLFWVKNSRWFGYSSTKKPEKKKEGKRKETLDGLSSKFWWKWNFMN
jgi:hypothetical protein